MPLLPLCRPPRRLTRRLSWGTSLWGCFGAAVLAMLLALAAPERSPAASTPAAGPAAGPAASSPTAVEAAGSATKGQQTVLSNYELARQAAFNRVEDYPIKALPSTSNYRPTGEWMGRLVLPTAADSAQTPGDWVWLEVWNAPIAEPNLLGQRVKLTWAPGSEAEATAQALTRPVQLSQQAWQAAATGVVVPARLQGRSAVGPLQSLAGAHPEDDITVRLDTAKLVLGQGAGAAPLLHITQEPVQVMGREYALVKILGPDVEVKKPLSAACPGQPPCPSEYFKVQHYNFTTGEFDGDQETVRIPQQPPQKRDRFASSIRDLARSPAGDAGWYLYGTRDAEDIFTVRSLKPRALFQLTPDQVVQGQTAARTYIDQQNWQDVPGQKGTLQRVLVHPANVSAAAARADWQEGDGALVVHLQGGLADDAAAAGTVAGHLAYGLAQVVREPFTQELQLDIRYQPLYGHNSSGIVAAAQDWSVWMGDLQRGWLGQRPVSDVVVKLDSFAEPLRLGEAELSVGQQLQQQLQARAARYRTGDGTGFTEASPAASLADANQALDEALEQIQQAAADPAAAAWLRQNSQDPQAQRVSQLAQLRADLRATLQPYASLRLRSGQLAAQVGSNDYRPWRLLLQWRALLPRRGQDELSRLFLRQGAALWCLRSNLVGGVDPALHPAAPTLLLGALPLLGTALRRLTDATAWQPWQDAGVVAGALLLYGAIALPYGFRSNFLKPYIALHHPVRLAINLLLLLLAPALIEELLFRVLLLPHPLEALPTGRWLLWAMLSLGLFVGYHFVTASTCYPAGKPTFFDRRFVLLAAWLGLVLTLAYWLSGSLWAVMAVHWGVVAVWLYALGGLPRLQGKFNQKPGRSKSTRPKRQSS